MYSNFVSSLQEFHRRRLLLKKQRQLQQQQPHKFAPPRPPPPPQPIIEPHGDSGSNSKGVEAAMTVSDDVVYDDHAVESDPQPPVGSRGAFGPSGHRELQQTAASGSSYLSTLDRRPGRPAFHHMGPPRAGERNKVPRHFRHHPQVRTGALGPLAPFNVKY